MLNMGYEGFIRGGSHPQEVENMARLFMWFRQVEHINRAIDIWERQTGRLRSFKFKVEPLTNKFLPEIQV